MQLFTDKDGMDSELDFDSLAIRCNEKILLGHNLIQLLETYKQIPGVQKIQRKINQEIKFLQKAIRTDSLKLNHVQCSNMTHYEFLVQILQLQHDVVSLDCGFTLENRTNRLRVDIVCQHGLRWIKAIARNSKSLYDVVKGEASYGAKSILDQAQEFKDGTAQHFCMFQQPKVVFYFSHAIENELLTHLQRIGVDTASLNQPIAKLEVSVNDVANIGVLNLDITTMLAYISAVTNGSCNWIFREAILTEQAEKERQTPLKSMLDQLFIDKRLICCETAYKSFQKITSLLGGPRERARALELMQRVEVLPDIVDIPEELSVIKWSGKINERSFKIFAFGMKMRAVTVTSNKAFIRSAKMQGINVPVYTHQARALTEAKEETGTAL